MFAFITAIREGRLGAAEDWQGLLKARLAEFGISFAPDWIECEGGRVLGNYTFLSRDEAARQFGAAPWFSLEPAPWVGGVAGFLAWSHLLDEQAALRSFVPRLVAHAWGVVARPDQGRFLEPVRTKSFSLDNLVRRHGFQDGDALLWRQGPYVEHVIDEIDRCIARADLDSQANVYPTHHNPIRLARDLRQNGVPVKDPERVLAALSVEIVAFDVDVLDDASFWLD